MADTIPSNVYVYKWHEERGHLTADVQRISDDDYVWQYVLGHEMVESSPVDDGYMRHWDDVAGLEKYLKSMSVLPPDAELLDREEAIRRYDYYAKGGKIPTKAGQKVMFREVVDEGDDTMEYEIVWIDAPRARIRALNTGMSIAPETIVNIDDLKLMSKGGKITPSWGNSGATPSNNKDYNELYELFPDNHTEAKAIWKQLNAKQKDGFINDLQVTDAGSEHIAESWIEFVTAKTEKDFWDNAINWDEMSNGEAANWWAKHGKQYAYGGKIIEVVGRGAKGTFRKREYDGMTQQEVEKWWIDRGYAQTDNKKEHRLKPFQFYVESYQNGGTIKSTISKYFDFSILTEKYTLREIFFGK